MSRKIPGSAIVSGSITVTQISGGLNDTTNAAYAQANTARDTGNNAYTQANTARSDANTTFATINTTFGTTNTSLGTINTNYQAAYAQANTARDTANNAYGSANLAYTQANNARSDANATFGTINSTFATLNTSAATQNTNISNAYDQANNARGQANTARDTANGAYGQANTARDTANSSYGQANTGYGQANAAYGQANAAYAQANAAYGAANTKLPLAGGTLSGDLIISGNLTVSGNQTILNTEVLTTEDAEIILLSNTSGTPALNAGLIVNRGTSTNTFVRWNEVTDKWGYSDDGTNFYSYDDIRSGLVTTNTTFATVNTTFGTVNTNVTNVNSNAANAYAQANTAYGQANTARTTANSAYTAANTAQTTAQNAYGQANSAYTAANTAQSTAQNAYGAANTAQTTAQNAYGQANTATTNAGTAQTTAQNAYGAANTAQTTAQNAYGQANTATTNAGTAQTTAQNAYGQANSAYTAANNRVATVSGTSGRITSSGTTAITLDLATAGAGAASYSSGISALTIDAYGRVTSVTGSAGYVPTNGTGASGTWGISITGNAATVGSLTPAQFFNNMGENHSARGSFDASTPSYGYGYRYIQGSTNGPGTGGTQYYSWYIGLGNDYPATGGGSYGMMFAIDRNVATPYLSVRYNESNSFTSWRKVAAGYADSAGTATSADQIDGVAFRNTGSNASTAADSLDQNGITYVATNISLFGQTDGALYSQAYSSSWQHQIYGDYRTGQIAIRGKNAGTWQSWRTVLDSSNYTSYPDSFDGLTSKTSGTGTYTTSGDFRAPIFYDSNNTGYYVDPASTTNINQLNGNGKVIFETGDTYLRINQNSSFTSGVWYGTSNRLSGTSYIAAGSNGSTTSSRVYIYGGTYDGTNVIYLDGSTGIGRATGDWRAPIFYDNNNTGYYTDPASTSVLNAVRFVGGLGSESVGSTSPNSVARVQFPNGGAFSSDGSTGAIKIRLPFRNNNSMWALKVRIYFYSTNTIGEYHIGAYSYNNGGYNAAASYQGSAGLGARNVRIGNDGSYDCIWIGETNSSWSYPVVSVTDVMGGFRNGTFSQFGGGWDISIVTSFGTVESTITPSITTSNLTSDSAFYTPIFYDQNNTGYYCDPASTSRLNAIYCGDVYNDLGGWFRNYGATGIYNQSYDNHFYSENSTYWTSATDNGMIFRNAYGGTVQGYVYFDGTGFGLLHSGGGWAVRTWNGGVQTYGALTVGTSTSSDIYMTDSDETTRRIHCNSNRIGFLNQSNGWGSYCNNDGSWSAPIFYDSDDTNSYFTSNDFIMRGSSPTVYFRDTDHNSAMLHCNSSLLYVLRGGNDTTTYTQIQGQWPFNWNLTNNDATCGGSFSAVGNIAAYASDRRLKTNIKTIENALEKVQSLSGVTFDWIDKVKDLGFRPDTMINDAGVIAQEVEAVFPQAIKLAPFDQEWDVDGNKYISRSGEDYKTVQYEKIVPLLIEAIKELKAEIELLKNRG